MILPAWQVTKTIFYSWWVIFTFDLLVVYPISINIKNRLCVVIGGGNVAARKVRGILDKQGRVKLISPRVNEQLAGLVDSGEITWINREYQSGDLEGSILVFAATADTLVQEAVQHEAEQCNILINRAESPEKSSFHVPASFQQGDLQVAVFTGGKSPAMAAKVKNQLKNELGAEYGLLLELISSVRERVIADYDDNPSKSELFHTLFHADMPAWIKTGKWDLVEQHFTSLLGKCDEIDWEAYRRRGI